MFPTIKIPVNHKENTGKGLLHHKNELFKSIYMCNHCWKVDTLLFRYIPGSGLKSGYFFKKQRERNDSLQTPEDSVLKTNWQVG